MKILYSWWNKRKFTCTVYVIENWKTIAFIYDTGPWGSIGVCIIVERFNTISHPLLHVIIKIHEEEGKWKLNNWTLANLYNEKWDCNHLIFFYLIQYLRHIIFNF